MINRNNRKLFPCGEVVQTPGISRGKYLQRGSEVATKVDTVDNSEDEEGQRFENSKNTSATGALEEKVVASMASCFALRIKEALVRNGTADYQGVLC